MEYEMKEVLKICIGQARKSERMLNVFDLMYETSLPYSELKEIFDKLVAQKELAVIDIKTYKFIGDIDREFEESNAKKPHSKEGGESSNDEDYLSARLKNLKERRQELIDEMRQAETEKESRDGWADKILFEDLFPFDTEESDTDEDAISDGPVSRGDAEARKLQKATEFIKTFLVNRSATPVLYTNAEFAQLVGESMAVLIASDITMSKGEAIGKARRDLASVCESKNTKLIPVYDCIIRELQGMSNYYYAKIRSLLV